MKTTPLQTRVRKADILDLSDEVGDWVKGFDPEVVSIHDFHKMLDRCPVPILVIWIFVENVCVLLLYLLLTWFFENGPGTYAVHASVFHALKVWRLWKLLETKVQKLAFKQLHCLNVEIDVVCFWYRALIPISDDLFSSSTLPPINRSLIKRRWMPSMPCNAGRGQHDGRVAVGGTQCYLDKATNMVSLMMDQPACQEERQA